VPRNELILFTARGRPLHVVCRTMPHCALPNHAKCPQRFVSETSVRRAAAGNAKRILLRFGPLQRRRKIGLPPRLRAAYRPSVRPLAR